MVGINLDVLFHTWTGRNHLLGVHMNSVKKDKQKGLKNSRTVGYPLAMSVFIENKY